jgi:hypothetical protein
MKSALHLFVSVPLMAAIASLCHEVTGTPRGEMLSIAGAVPFPVSIRGRTSQVSRV